MKRISERNIVPYLKAKYPHMYKGNDDSWCRMREDVLLLLLKSYDVELLLDAQLESCQKEHDKIVQEIFDWLNEQFGFKIDDEIKQKWGVE